MKDTAWKGSKYGVFLVRIFSYSDWLQENADQKNLRTWTLFTQCDFHEIFLRTSILINYSYLFIGRWFSGWVYAYVGTSG